MASLNKVQLIGHLGREPEVRYLPSGDPVANINLATTDRYKDRATGEMKESTEWHRISFFGKLADIAGQYLKKGSLVYIEGSLRTRKFNDKDGVERYSTEIRGETLQMLGNRPTGSQQAQSAAPNQRRPQATSAPPSHSVQDFDDMGFDPFHR